MKPEIESLPILILYPHSRCNCRCLMCDIWKTDTIQEISAEELERHAGDIERLRVEWVVFSGGEPLMHSDLFRLCRILRDRGIRTTILSTGLLLERHAARIAEDVDEVIVSLDGPPAIHDLIRRVPGAFNLMEKGVHALLRLRPDFSVLGRSTVQRLNCSSLRATTATARDVGLRSISFLAADLTSTAFNRVVPWSRERQGDVGLSRDELSALDAEIEALINLDLCGKFVLETPAKLRRVANHFRAHLGMAEPVAPLCNAPWVSAVIEADGTVRPCFFHAPVGDLRNGRSLSEVLNSPEATRFRSRLDVAANPVCRRCVCSLNWGAA